MLEECGKEKIELLRREDSQKQSYIDIVPDCDLSPSEAPSLSTDAEEQQQQKETNDNDSDNAPFTVDSDLSRADRRIWVVTTAALPWMTGTAVNPLMRALFLTRNRPKHAVTLLLPWLQDAAARTVLYGNNNNNSFESPQQQEAWIRDWCSSGSYQTEAENLDIQFWNGIYHHGLGSIFPAQDICSLIPSDQADVAILEEPEHLNWFRVSPQNMGWADKFTFVVGILHTNYGSYIKQYGMGTSLLTAPALNALSTLVCKAYCHRLIRLSDTLTSFCPEKEITSNVHGVRAEFFALQQQQQQPSSVTTTTTTQTQPAGRMPAVYFIGKLIWAKGFEAVLQLQDKYRLQHDHYFAMDIYGTGNDSKAIQRAFFGRSHKVKRQGSDDSASSGDADFLGKDDQAAAEIFDRDESLRCMLKELEEGGTEVVDRSMVVAADDEDDIVGSTPCAAPLGVITDLSKRTLGTGVETAGAALQLVESALTQGFGGFQKEADEDSGDDKTEDRKKEGDSKPAKKKRSRHPFRLGPSLAAYKWRRTPIPARFMGRKDHLEMKESPQNIFLNMSTSEVLCTTSAEALAMGKYVILPQHPSNTFFYQFPNCLAYTDLDDCVDKLQHALANKPKPLTEEDIHKLSWEGAVERLYDASGTKEGQECSADLKAARFHVETAKKSQYVTSLFNGTLLRR